MSNLILPQKWTSQPQTPVGIDWSNPLSPKSGIWIPDRNLVNGRGITLGGSGGVPTSTIIPSGRALYTNGQYVQTDNPANAFSVCTWLAIIKPAAAPTSTNYSAFFQTSQVTLNWNHASAGYQGAFTINNGGAYPTAKFTSGFTAGAEVVIGGTYDGISLRIYRNGVLENTVVAGNSLSGVTVNSLQFLGGQGGTASWAGSCSLFYWDQTKAVPSAGMALLSANPWQIFKPQARRIWVAAAGGGDATATITGVSGSAQVGTVSTSGNASVSLPGASGAGSVGNVVASVSAATAITGVNGAGQVGNTTQTGAANVAVSTVAGTGQVGTVSASGIGAPDGNVAITGIAGTGQVGTLAASGNGAVSITGIAATGSVGSVTPSVTVTTTITGAIGTGSVGTTTQTGAANATVSSAVGIGLVGTVSATGTSQDGNAVISGISGIGSVGIVSANDGTVVNNHGFIIIDTEPRLWWKRKPSKLDDKKAEEKIFKVARVIERVVKHVANSNEPSVSKEVYRKAAYAEVAPLLREMPGFDWSPMFRAILTQSKLQEQNRIAAEQAGILAKQEIERIKRIRDDEEALIVLLMGA